MTDSSTSSLKLNPNVSVDCAIFGFDFDELNVLLIERMPPTPGKKGKDMMLPGNLIREDEDLDQSAQRVLSELTGLSNIFMHQFLAFGAPDRVKKESDIEWLRSVRAEPDARVITVAYFSLVKLDSYKPHPSLFARKAEWIPISKVPELAFDHTEILEGALIALRNQIRTRPVGFELLPKKFTLGQLQKLYENILGTELDKRNFRRKFLNKGILVELDEKQKGVPHKPAKLYKFDKKKYLEVRSMDFDFVM